LYGLSSQCCFNTSTLLIAIMLLTFHGLMAKISPLKPL
jgi:hypothetical protein